MDAELISESLEAASNRRTAASRGHAIHPLRGIRGVSDADIAKVLAAAWKKGDVSLDRDETQLVRLFSGGFEDGLVAIGLVAAALPDDPETAWDLGADWLARLDDILTADALGWLVLGPSLLATARPAQALLELGGPESHEAVRRAIVAAGLAMTPEPLQGPVASALRERLGERHIRFVDDAVDVPLAALVSGMLRDEATGVRKALRRVVRAWAKSRPAAVVAWADTVRGGLPKLLGAEVTKARRRAGREEA